MVLSVGQQLNFIETLKVLSGFDGFDIAGYQRTYYQGRFPSVGISGGRFDNGRTQLNIPASLQEINSLTIDDIIDTRFSGTEPTDGWGNIQGQPAIVYDSSSKQRGDGIISSVVRDVSLGEISIEGAVTLNSVVDCPWNSVHHVFGVPPNTPPEIIYMNNGSISQFLHVFIGGLGKNITWIGNDVFIASNPLPGDEVVYVERWEIDPGPPARITQTEDLLVEAISLFNANNPNVFGTSYYPSA